MNLTSLHIRFNPLVKKIHSCSKCYLEIIPNVLDDEQLDNIDFKDDNSSIECNIPMEYKIILRKHTENKNVEENRKCDIEKIYHSCVDLIVESSKSMNSVKEFIRHKSETSLLDQIMADFANFNPEILNETNIRATNNEVHGISLIFKSSALTLQDLNSLSVNENKKMYLNKVSSLNKLYNDKGLHNVDSNPMQKVNQTSTKRNKPQEQKIKASTNNNSADSKILSFSPLCSINTKDDIIYPASYQISHLKQDYTVSKISDLFNYDINLIKTRNINKEDCKWNQNISNVLSMYNYCYTKTPSVEDRVAELLYFMKKEMLPLKMMFDETIRKSVALGLSVGRGGDVQAYNSLRWNTALGHNCRSSKKSKALTESNRVVYKIVSEVNMDDQYYPKELARSLSFEVEAIPQDNTIQLTSSTNNNNPLNVKIKVRKKKDLESPQNAVLSIPKFSKRGTKPERIRLASSDQTIISFNVYMEEADEKITQKSKKKFFGLFKSGGALDSDSSLENEIQPQKLNKLETIVNETKTSRKDRGKGIFGKSKPGGCLDPPFGEDKYAYEAVKNMQSTSEPYQTQEVKLKEKDDLSVKNDSINKLKPIKKKTSLEDGTFDDKTSKTEKSSVLSLFQADSFKPPVEISYSNSIITYPPPLTSSEMRVFNAINEKNLKNKSSIDRSSFQDPTDRYFGPKRESGSRKSSKIEGIKEGDKGILLAPEHTKYLRTYNENILDTKASPSKNEIIKDTVLPVAGGLIASTLLQSLSRESVKRDSMIDAQNAQVTGNEEIPEVKRESPKKKDHFSNEILKDSVLPIAGGLIAATLPQASTKEKLKQDRIIDPENAQVIDSNKDSINKNKELQGIKVEQESPDKKDQFTNEILKASMLPVAGGLIAATLPQAFTEENLKQDRIIDPENVQVPDQNKYSTNENKEIPNVDQEQPEKKDNLINNILKDSMLPVAGGLIAATLPQAFSTEKLKKDRIIDHENAQVTDPNKDSINRIKGIPKVEQEPPEKKDHVTNEIFKDFSDAGGLIAATLPQAFAKEELEQEKNIDPENAQLPVKNKDNTSEREPTEKKADSINEILKDFPVAEGLIASSLPKAHSKEKVKQDEIINPGKAQITDPHKDSINRNKEIPKIEQEPPEKKNHVTNEIFKDFSVSEGLIAATLPQAFAKEELEQEKYIDPENAQLPFKNKDSISEREPSEKKDDSINEILKDSPVAGGLIASTLPKAVIKEMQKDEQIPLEKKEHFTNEILKDSMLPAAEGLIASTQPETFGKEKFKEDRIFDPESSQISVLSKYSANGNKQIPEVEQESPVKKDNLTNKILTDSMLPVTEDLIRSKLQQAFATEKLKQDGIIDPENYLIPDPNKNTSKENKEIPKTELKPPKKDDHLTNKILNDSMSPLTRDLLGPTLPQAFGSEELKQNRIISPDNVQVTDSKKDFANDNKTVPKVEQKVSKNTMLSITSDLTALPHGKEKLSKEVMDTENDQVSNTNEDRAFKKLSKVEQGSPERIDYPKNEVLKDKTIPDTTGLVDSSQQKSKSTENIKQEEIISPENAHTGTDKDNATEINEIQKVEKESLEKIPLDIQEQSNNYNIPIEKTTSSVLTKLSRVMSTTSDELQEQRRNSQKEINNLLVENTIGGNKEIEEKILKSDIITNYEENILFPVSTETEESKSQKTGAPFLLEKELTLKDDTFIRDEQQNVFKKLNAEEVDTKISYKGVDSATRLEKNNKDDSEDNTLKERDILFKEKYAYKEPVSGSDLVLDNVTENIQPKITVPLLKDEIKSPEDIVIQEQRTKLDSGFEELFPYKNILRTSPDQEEDEIKTDTIKDTPRVQGASKKVEAFQDYIQSREEYLKGVSENKEKLIIPEQEKQLQSETLTDTQLKASDQNDALKVIGSKEDFQNELLNRDIQRRPNLEPRDESSYLFDHGSFAHKPVQFPSPEDDNRKKDNIVHEINPELKKQENKVIVLSLAFQNYVNEDNKRVFKSVDDSKPIERFKDDRILSFKSVVEPDGLGIRVPIDPENDLYLGILKKGSRTSESRKILKITPEFHTDYIKSRKSKSKEPLKLTEEINRNNYETKSENSQYKLQKGLEKHEQQLETKLVTDREKPVQQLESTLVTDGKQTDHRLEPKLATSLKKPDQQPELTLTKNRVKQDHQPEFKIIKDYKKSDEQLESKLVTSWERRDHQPESKLVADRKKQEKQVASRRKKLGIETDSSIHETDMYSLHHNLSSVYEQHLVPLKDLIKILKQEIDSLASQQELLRHNLLGVTKLKSMRVHATKKCICQRKL